MKTLIQVRQEYESNYKKILDIITKMGGDEYIKFHRQKKSTLYRKLTELQRKEHYLDELENRMHTRQSVLH